VLCVMWWRLTWCVPFVITAAPSLLLALLLIFTVQEPPRGGESKVLHIFCATCVSFFKANNAGTRCMWCTVHWDQCRRHCGRVRLKCCTRWCRLS
jgi:hypothetical protein